MTATASRQAYSCARGTVIEPRVKAWLKYAGWPRSGWSPDQGDDRLGDQGDGERDDDGQPVVVALTRSTMNR